MGCLYKITSKLLSNRLKLVIGEVINDIQTSLIWDRYITNGILTANEVVMWLKSKRKSGELFKVDFKRSYDLVRCSFLEHMLRQVGAGPRMRNCLLWYIKTTIMSIMINVSLTQPLKMQKSIRQVNPKSSFMFTIISEALPYIIHKARYLDLVSGVSLG